MSNGTNKAVDAKAKIEEIEKLIQRLEEESKVDAVKVEAELKIALLEKRRQEFIVEEETKKSESEPESESEPSKDIVELYAELILSNGPWKWDNDLLEGLSAGKKSLIRDEAIRRGLLPAIAVTRNDSIDESDPEKCGCSKRLENGENSCQEYEKYKKDPGKYGEHIKQCDTLYTRSYQLGFAEFPSRYIRYTHELPFTSWDLSDTAQFKESDVGYHAKMNIKKDNTATWHHMECPGKMHLVERGIHNFVAHNGGRTNQLWANINGIHRPSKSDQELSLKELEEKLAEAEERLKDDKDTYEKREEKIGGKKERANAEKNKNDIKGSSDIKAAEIYKKGERSLKSAEEAVKKREEKVAYWKKRIEEKKAEEQKA